MDRIIVYGGEGDDKIKVHNGLGTIAAELYGGAGNDQLRGGNGNDVLVGGAGNDLLSGFDGRDLLIGGLGQDKVIGNNDDDILIGGVYLHEDSRVAIDAIMAEWSRTDQDYLSRVTHLRDGGGLSAYLLNDSTVSDDGVKDTLRGMKGFDWFIANQDDDKTDADLDEILTQVEIDFLTDA